MGTRLAPLTNQRQKCMLDINGKPCLERVIEHIQSFGISDIIVKVHYKYEQVMDYFGSRVLYFYQKELKDEGQSLLELSHWVNNEFVLVANGDTLTNVNIYNMMNLGDGGNVKFMDIKDVNKYAGTMLLSPYYWQGKKEFQRYYDPEAHWMDIGNFSGLNDARKFYHEQEK